MNEKNLIPFTQRTESEARELGKKGGKASGKARKEIKTFKEAVNLVMSLPEKDPEMRNVLESIGIKGKDATKRMKYG